jgi:hypothetical protein
MEEEYNLQCPQSKTRPRAITWRQQPTTSRRRSTITKRRTASLTEIPKRQKHTARAEEHGKLARDAVEAAKEHSKK